MKTFSDVIIGTRYEFMNHVPAPHNESLMLELRNEIAQLETERILRGLFHGERMEFLERELARIPMERAWDKSAIAINVVPDVGANDILDKYLSGSAYTAAFYMLLMNSSGYTGVAVGDTMASHAGWTEQTANYSETTRPAISFASAASRAKATASAVTFTITALVSIEGVAIVTNNTKGGTSGLIISGAAFTGGVQTASSGTLTGTSNTSIA